MVKVVTDEPGSVTLRDLTLPHGPYEVRVFKKEGGAVRELSHRFAVPPRSRATRREYHLDYCCCLLL